MHRECAGGVPATIAHKMIPELIIKPFRFGNSSTDITE